jgi:hypothetical protein
MSDARKKPCCICRCWFRPDPRIGLRQRACRNPDYQVARRRKKQKQWRERNPDYFIAHRILDRGKADRAPEPLRLPRPLSQFPWDIAQFEFGVKGTDFIGVLSTVLLRDAQSQFQVYLTDSARLSGTLPPARRNPRWRLWHRPAVGSPGMKLEFHRLDRRHEHLRNAQRQRQLLASLATPGQQKRS